jgi:alanine racemase
MKNPIASGTQSWVEIHLPGLKKNLEAIRKRLNPSTKIMGVVKADAYGHGLVPVARELIGLGVPALAVGSMVEGIQIREKVSTKVPVVALLGLYPEETAICLQNDLTPVLYTLETAQRLHKAAQRRKIRLPIHLKIDTGMGRLGIPWSEFGEFLKRIKTLKTLEVRGLTSHLGQADERERPYNRSQWNRFEIALAQARENGLELSENHIGNSAALINFKHSHLHYIRPGILLYGSNSISSPGRPGPLRVDPLMTLKSRILQVKQVPPGVEVSYGGTYITSKPETHAVLSIGYANGYPRILSNRSHVLIKGKRFPIIGRICMNLLVVRVDKTLSGQEGEEVVLLGRQGREAITPEELAGLAETISYELFCLFGSLNTRKYLVD